MPTNLPPARERIEKAASEHGWLPRWSDPDRIIKFTRGQEQVGVTFTEQSPSRPLAQRVKGAWSTQPDRNGVHSSTQGITGPDKTGQVIARLAQPRAY